MTERLENLMGEVAGIARDQETLQSQTENQSEKLIIQRNPVLNQENKAAENASRPTDIHIRSIVFRI